MSKKIKKILFISTSIVLLLFLAYGFLSFTGVIREFTLKRESKPIIEKIEEYKIKNGFYPKKLSDAGLPEPDESGPIFYKLKDSTHYEIICAIGFESINYDSKTKKWYP